MEISELTDTDDSQQLWEILVDEVDEHDLFMLSDENHRADAMRIGNGRYMVTFSDLTKEESERLFNDISDAHLMVGNIKIQTFPYVAINRQ